MSMWINLARVTPEAFEKIKRDPHLLGPLFLEQDDGVLATLGVVPEDISGLDYDSATQMLEAIADIDQDAIEIDGEAGDADDRDADDRDADERDDDSDDDDDDDEDDAGDAAAAAGEDAAAAAAAADDDEEQGDLVLVDLCIDGTLPYDAGFGSAFFLTPAAAKQAAASSVALGVDDEAKAIVHAAGERGHYIVGVVS